MNVLTNLYFKIMQSNRALWILCEIMAICASYTLMHNSWIRYNENPTVITVQKDYRNWYLQFPSATFCYVDPVDTDFAKAYIIKSVRYHLRKNC